MNPLKWLLGLAVAAISAIAIFIYAGCYNIGADAPHYPLTLKLIETLRSRSITVRADEIPIPVDLSDPERRRRGAGNYDAMCAGCHLAPGVASTEIREGLYPQPPNLAEHHAKKPALQFWAIKHGIKMTAMPAWTKGGMQDSTIWDLVALLQALPNMTADEYRALVDSSEGHKHAGMHTDEGLAPSEPSKESVHKHHAH